MLKDNPQCNIEVKLNQEGQGGEEGKPPPPPAQLYLLWWYLFHHFQYPIVGIDTWFVLYGIHDGYNNG